MLNETHRIVSEETGPQYYIFYHFDGLLKEHTANGLITKYYYNKNGTIQFRQQSGNKGGNYTNWYYGSSGQEKGKLTKVFMSHTNGVLGDTLFTYTGLGLLDKYTQTIENTSYILDYDYDTSGRVTTLNYPGGNKAHYVYNSYGDLTDVRVTISGVTKSLVSNIKRKPNGLITSYTFGNGIARDLTYDKNYRLTGIFSNDIQDLTYQHDRVGNITSLNNGIQSIFSQTFDYDSENQLTNIYSLSGNESFTYDNAGNRKTRTAGSNSDTYLYSSAQGNRLTQVNRNNTIQHINQYDSNGNLAFVKSGGFSILKRYEYDGHNQLLSADSHQYQYNSLRQRVYKNVNNYITHFVYDLNGLLMAEGMSKQYIYLDDQIIGYIKNGVLYYVHTDQIGRPEVITKSDQTQAWRAGLKAFDRSVLFSGLGDFNIGFPGQYYDSETLLWYNINRYYDPETGRYIQSDPIGLAGGLNTYAYALGNPIIHTDPLGLDVWSDLRDVTGGCGSGSFTNDVVDNYVNVMDSTGGKAAKMGASLIVAKMGIDATMGNSTIGQAAKSMYTDYKNGYKIEGVGSRSFLDAGLHLTGSFIKKSTLVTGMYSSGVLAGSALRTGANRLGAAMTDEKCGCGN